MADTYGQSKSDGIKALAPAKGGASGDSRGGSSRSYPKGGSKPSSSQSAPYNPQKVAATSKYVGGI
jgi:hypothetical protein